MDSVNLKTHLNSISIKQIKTLIRQYNLHHKIKLSQNKPDLISDLLKHFETDTIDNKMISKKNDMEIPKIEEPKPKAPRKPRIKKEDKEDILKRLMKSNKDADDKFEQDDKLIRQLIKEQNVMKKDKLQGGGLKRKIKGGVMNDDARIDIILPQLLEEINFEKNVLINQNINAGLAQNRALNKIIRFRIEAKLGHFDNAEIVIQIQNEIDAYL